MPTDTAVNKFSNHAGRTVSANFPLRLVAMLGLLTAAPLVEAHRITAFSNGDIWWHLSTGRWMLQNHAFPHYGLFSQYPDHPWIASTWGFDVLAAVAYKLLGLRAIPFLLVVLKLALAAVTFLLAYIGHRKFWIAVLLSAAAQYVIVDLQPLPNLFSILFFGIELILLLQSRRSGDVRPLVWLPLLFCCWANLHPQFVLGLALLAVFLLAGAVEFLLHRMGFHSFTPPALPSLKTFAIAGITFAATLVTPYSFRLISEVCQTIYNKEQFRFFSEMSSMDFRRPEHFVLMLLVMAALLALGRQRSRDLFKIVAMGTFVMLAFRVQRDAWCIVLPAIAVLADAFGDLQFESVTDGNAGDWKWKLPLGTALVLVILSVAILRMPKDELLLGTVSRVFPVKACDYIRENRLAGPIFNSYAWGGFLTWYLPEYPVAIDGRLNLYGEGLTDQYFKLTGGSMRVEDDPSFARARVILMERRSGVTIALTSLPILRQQFQVAYEDDVAAVLVRVSPGE